MLTFGDVEDSQIPHNQRVFAIKTWHLLTKRTKRPIICCVLTCKL